MSAVKVRWVIYLVGSLLIGILLGIPQGLSYGRQEQTRIAAANEALPVVDVTENDYRTENSEVPAFSSWGHNAVARVFEDRYPPEKIDRRAQKLFYDRVVGAALNKGEPEPVIRACAEHAISISNSTLHSTYVNAPHTQASTLLIYAEKASYFGQDAWCFLCLTTPDHTEGTARVVVISATPPFGLLHLQDVGTFSG